MLNWSQPAGEEGTSPNRDASLRQKKRVTFFNRNNNIVKKTSNESRQTSLIEENVTNVVKSATTKENAKNVTTNGKNGDEQNVTEKCDDSESDDASSQSGDDKIRKISE